MCISISQLTEYISPESAIILHDLFACYTATTVETSLCFFGIGGNGKTTVTRMLEKAFPGIMRIPAERGHNHTYFREQKVTICSINSEDDARHLQTSAKNSGATFIRINFPYTFDVRRINVSQSVKPTS